MGAGLGLLAQLTALTPSQMYTTILNSQWPYTVLLIVLLYPLLAASLRSARLRSTLRTFPYTTRDSFARMTDDDAFEIQLIMAQLEFPFTFTKALQFALFRTYGISSISRVLVATSQLSDIATASKRYADTAVLIREFMSHRPSEPRTLEAIARMNYIHSLYQKSGQIQEDDMLFTLSLFAIEPIRWIGRYEWRQLEQFEQCALGTFWKSIGDAMGIRYRKLKSAQEGWMDGLHWLKELEEWSELYENENMVPHLDNKKIADETVAILLWGIPKPLQPFGARIVSALMDDRLRTAMMYGHQNFACRMVIGALTVRPGTKSRPRSTSPWSRASLALGSSSFGTCSYRDHISSAWMP